MSLLVYGLGYGQDELALIASRSVAWFVAVSVTFLIFYDLEGSL